MSLTVKEQEELCQLILESRRIKGKIVVLCEGQGNIEYLKKVLSCRKMEDFQKLGQVPDANFWRATVPRCWQKEGGIPIFISCGGRDSVLTCYQKLQNLHRNDPDKSCLSPEKLFVLIDLDIQTAKLEKVCPHIGDTERLYDCMYNGLKINKEIVRDTHILITGWIHKEAYFLEPDLQEVFDKSEYQLFFENSELRLDNIYQKMAEDLPDDKDLKNHFFIISKRIKKLKDISLDDKIKQKMDKTDIPKEEKSIIKTEILRDIWKKKFAGANGNHDEKRLLAEMLLTIRKAKPYWESMTIRHPAQESDEQTIRDSFMLGVIAPFYSNKYSQDENPTGPYHIPQWMQILREYS